MMPSLPFMLSRRGTPYFWTEHVARQAGRIPPWLLLATPIRKIPTHPVPRSGRPRSHGLRNEIHFRLKRLGRLVQYLHFSLARHQTSPYRLETEKRRIKLSSRINAEVKLVAHPVGGLFQDI